MLHNLSIRQLRAQLDSKQISAVELAQYFLDRSAAHSDLNAFIRTDAEVTLTQARAADASIAQRRPCAQSECL